MDSWILCWNMGPGIDPRPEVPAPKARRGAQHVMDFGDGLDVGVDVERRHGVLVAEDRLERLDIAALADPLRCERVAKAVERDQLVVGAHEAVGLRERLERPAGYSLSSRRSRPAPTGCSSPRFRPTLQDRASAASRGQSRESPSGRGVGRPGRWGYPWRHGSWCP